MSGLNKVDLFDVTLVCEDGLVTIPGDRIAGQDTRYNISCAVNSVCDRTAGVACEVVLELVKHFHDDSLLQVRDVTKSLPNDHQSESVQCCVAFQHQQQFHISGSCVVSQLSAAQLTTTQTTGFFEGALFTSQHLLTFHFSSPEIDFGL